MRPAPHELPAEVRIVDPEGAPTIDADGAARSVQAAELTIPADALVELWTPATLERLARTYWRFLERSSLGLIRVRYAEHDRAVVLLCRPFVLIGFDPPEYELGAERGIVRWQIRHGALVSHRQSAAAASCRSTCAGCADPAPGYAGDPRRGRGAQLLPGDRQRALQPASTRRRSRRSTCSSRTASCARSRASISRSRAPGRFRRGS